ncbi:DNA-binding MarR family transcriptional regulator [Yoonia maricola]|uniref:DNA-binding MarR family transcriptional regulator n=1 Tax=Yoonia maricola TaxID=420999 RepID=A0A2M8W4Z0_9RHOB|nr:MarR family transcriptional regulator [Yoonia maricola]PJI85991.1 DNA-binding MarR family transcriptional regulator [Yoonia maricola]
MLTLEEATPQDLVAACRRLYASIDRLDAKAANTVGVSRNDLRCLNMLAEEPAKPSKIAEELGLTTGSVTTLLDRLERANLAKRERDPDDRRGIIVRPTPYLFETLGPIYSGVAKEIERTAAEYSTEERKAAVKHLNDASSAYEVVTSLDDR